MAKSIPLPKLTDLPEVVVFHRNHPAEQRLLLHVPTSISTGETYPVRLDVSEHKQWLNRLPNNKVLLDKLMYEMHVAYYPHKAGTVMPLTDPDEIPWVRQVFAAASVGQGKSTLDKHFAMRTTRHKQLPAPALHTALGGRYS